MSLNNFTPKVNITGNKYGKLKVLRHSYKKYWFCLCDCGNKKNVRADHLASGATKSCGCIRDGNPKHGLTGTIIYNVWLSMKQRCCDKNHKSYKNYGGRDINVCSEWENDAVSFVEWSLKNGWEKGLQIDRKNNDLGYSPENCRFVTPLINSRNRRSEKSTFSGCCGVTFRNGKWVSRIMVLGKAISLGSYSNLSDAKIARYSAEEKYGFHQ